jgi:hypothetical protein
MPAARRRSFAVANGEIPSRRALTSVAASALVAGLLVAGNHGATAATSTWSGNLLTGNQANFDSGVGGWAALSSATRVARSALVKQSGSASLAITKTGAGPDLVTVASGTNPTAWTKATPGNRYKGHASVRAGTTGRPLSAAIAFLNLAGTVLDQAVGAALVDSSSSWQGLTDAVAIAPPSTAYAVLEVNVANAATLETHYVDNAFLSTAHGGAGSVVGPLHTSGNKILDGNGNPVIFHGFTRAGLEGGGGDAPTADDMSHAKAWGANFIRLPLGEQLWLSSSCQYDPSYVGKVDDAVNLITGMGMVAVLELSYLEAKPCGPAHQWPMADNPNSLTFWQAVAARYQNNPRVAFDLFNEPFGISDSTWRNGGTVTWKGTTYQAAGMQQLYNTVRGTGATNLVFVSGNNWANSWPKTAPLSGTNIVYAVHAYTCPGSPPPHCANTAPYNPAQFFRWWVAPSKVYPVMVTEFGWPDTNDGTYLGNVIQYATKNGWGWSPFTWGDSTWGTFALLATAGAGTNYEPNPTGMPALAAFPGS